MKMLLKEMPGNCFGGNGSCGNWESERTSLFIDEKQFPFPLSRAAQISISTHVGFEGFKKRPGNWKENFWNVDLTWLYFSGIVTLNNQWGVENVWIKFKFPPQGARHVSYQIKRLKKPLFLDFFNPNVRFIEESIKYTLISNHRPTNDSVLPRVFFSFYVFMLAQQFKSSFLGNFYFGTWHQLNRQWDTEPSHIITITSLPTGFLCQRQLLRLIETYNNIRRY